MQSLKVLAVLLTMEQVTLRTHALRARANISAHAWTACSQVNAFTLNVFSLRRRLRERKEEVLTVAGVCVPYGEEETSSVWPPPRQRYVCNAEPQDASLCELMADASENGGPMWMCYAPAPEPDDLGNYFDEMMS